MGRRRHGAARATASGHPLLYRRGIGMVRYTPENAPEGVASGSTPLRRMQPPKGQMIGARRLPPPPGRWRYRRAIVPPGGKMGPIPRGPAGARHLARRLHSLFLI